MRTFYQALLRHRVLALVALFAVTIAFGRLLVDPSRLRVDFSLEALLVPDAQARADLEALHADFGDDVGFVGVVIARPPPRTVVEPDALAAIGELRAWLAARPEIDREGVVTLLDLPDLRAATIVPEALRASPTEATARALAAHRSFRALLSKDLSATLIMAPFAVAAADERRPLLDALEPVVAALGEHLSAEARLVGVPLVQATYAEVALRDIVLLVPVTIVVIALLLGFAFRRFYAVVGPLAGVGLATIWTLGLIQALGLPFDMVNSVAGVVILVVGVAEGAHIVARHREEAARLAASGHADAHHEAIFVTMKHMTPACFVTSATTAVGFGSLASASLPAIVAFGAVLAAGVMMAWAIQMVLMPIVLSFSRVDGDDVREPLGNGLFGRFLDRVAVYVLRQPMKVALVALVTAAVAGVGALNLRAGARAAGELQPDHPVARGLTLLEERLAGVLVHAVAISGRGGGACQSDDDCAPDGPRSHPVCRRVDLGYRAVATVRDALGALAGPTVANDDPIVAGLEAAFADAAVVEGTCTETVTTPAVVAFIAELEGWVGARARADAAAGRPVLVSQTASLVDLLVDLRRGGPLPTDAGVLLEAVGVLENGAGALTSRYLTPDHTRTQLVLRANDIGLAAWRAFEPELRAEVDRLLQRHGLVGRVDVLLSGGATLAERAVSGIARDLLDSVAFDFLLILVFIVGLVRSLRLGLLAMVPNLWPLLVTLGTMGFLDVPIRASTIIVFSVALGIAVDDTTHFVHRYREEVQKDGEGAAAIRRTVAATGRPIVLTSIILVAGFLVNGLSDFAAIVEFGMLSAVTLGLALVTELFLTPALLLLAKGKLGRL